MRWEGNRQSDNVEDRRGLEDDGSGGTGSGGFGSGGRGGRGLGLGAVAVAFVASYFLGVSPTTLLNLLGSLQGAPQQQTQQQVQAPQGRVPDARTQDPTTAFVRTVLADTEDTWSAIFQQHGGQYRAPRLVIFEGSTPTACGDGQSAMGPFYCPADQKVYIDLGFFRTLKERLGAPGEFAQAYVVAHEVAHHVQNLMGTAAKVDALRGRVSAVQQNALSVRMELQADCYAGVWAHHADSARHILERGDIESALNAAAKIGDDALQQKAQGVVVPESFTHGSSAQRVTWFQTGLESGDVARCDTFKSRL